MDLKTLMNTRPEDLAELQFNELKQFAINKLEETTKLLNQNRFEEMKKLLVFSPAGDAYGTDSHFINFDYGFGSIDLKDIIDILEDLNKHIIN